MNKKFNVEIPDNNYWKGQIKCQDACPVHTDARGYVRAIAAGDFEKAYLIARGPNPLASICGRVCGAPCEAACRRGDLDDAVSIRALKRFVTERFGVESPKHKEEPAGILPLLQQDRRENCEDTEDIVKYKSHLIEERINSNSPTVGIIGSGPAGLAAAHDLCLMGIKPVIYELEPVPAGMLYLGIPEYRLPRDLIKAEIEVIKELGTEIKCNTRVGKDISFKKLKKIHQAILIAVGAKKSRTIPIPNVDAPGVEGGIDLLRDISLGNSVNLGKEVIVIGGGNVAYDVARTLVRQTEIDISKTALNQQGVEKVHLVCLESRKEMLADDIEVEEGSQEGVIRHNSWGPKEILVDANGHANGVRFVKCLSVSDEHGRFAPKYDENNVWDLKADKVFLSVGQQSDLSFLSSKQVPLTERGLLDLDKGGVRTKADGVFAAGDVAHGPRLLIDAVAAGKKAAREIYQYITGKSISFSIDPVHQHIAEYNRSREYEIVTREEVPVTQAERRKFLGNMAVEKGFQEDQGINQAARCLNCGVNTIFDSDKCILCGGCADVCPESCLKLVAADNLTGNADFEKLIDVRFEHRSLSDSSAIIKDETRCIRCGLCAKRLAPNGR